MVGTDPITDSEVGTPSRDGTLRSVWQGHSTSAFRTESQSAGVRGKTWDVLIIGGGITGLTTALRLQEMGRCCLVLEAHEIGFGTTGGTTAHINTLLDMPYDTLERNFGTDGARLVADATHAGRDVVAHNVSKYGIACDFSYQDGILFAQNKQEAEELQTIYAASQGAGVDVERVGTIPLPLDFHMAIAYKMQAQIHPLEYLYALAREFEAAGGVIVQHARALESKRVAGIHHVETSTAGSIKAHDLVYATHIPPGINVLHFRCAPYRSYVLAAQVSEGQYPDGLAYDMHKPYHYFRTHQAGGKRYLVLGGADHKVGHGDPHASFRELGAYLQQHFEVSSVDYRWSAQFFESTDGLPYIGRLPGSDDNTYVATGFGGNGILFGSFAASLLTDLIAGAVSPYEKLFSPLRVKPVAGFRSFVKENADVVYRFVSDRLHIDKLEALVELVPGTGAVVRLDDKKIAIYKSPEGAISALSPVCTHAGCIVRWNDAEKSWDCPCHGGRYDVNGEVLTGPPRKNLDAVPLLAQPPMDGKEEKTDEKT